MNMVDRLLKADVVNKLAERPEKKVKMERLSKLFGFDFVITLRAIDPERYADIQKMAVDFTNGSADNIDIYQMQTQTLLAGIADPDLKNKDLLEKFGAVLPGDIIRKIFLAGEIADLTAQITELNGYPVPPAVWPAKPPAGARWGTACGFPDPVARGRCPSVPASAEPLWLNPG